MLCAAGQHGLITMIVVIATSWVTSLLLQYIVTSLLTENKHVSSQEKALPTDLRSDKNVATPMCLKDLPDDIS